MTAEEVVRFLGLIPHPEGGFYRETFRAAGPASVGGGRGASPALDYLLRAGDVSAWHRTDADEVWHHYAGGALELSLSVDGRERSSVHLGFNLAAGERPQAVVPAGVWQSARPLGGWVLAGCTVAPAFDFAGFEMAPPGWEPGL
jgi:predicted cupin superfamily sugar epimerase